MANSFLSTCSKSVVSAFVSPSTSFVKFSIPILNSWTHCTVSKAPCFLLGICWSLRSQSPMAEIDELTLEKDRYLVITIFLFQVILTQQSFCLDKRIQELESSDHSPSPWILWEWLIDDDPKWIWYLIYYITYWFGKQTWHMKSISFESRWTWIR